MNEFSLSKRRRGRPPVSYRGLDSAPDPLFAEVLPLGRPSPPGDFRIAWAAEIVLPSGTLVRLAAHAPSSWVQRLLRSC